MNGVQVTDELFPVEVEPDSTKITEKKLCYVLNKNLRVAHTQKIIEKNHVMAVPHNGEIRSCVLCGVYKEEPEDYYNITSDTMSAEMWKSGGDVALLETLIENPLSIIVSAFLAPIQYSMLEKVYEMIDVQHNLTVRKAIACAYYDPDTNMVGQVLKQEWRIE